MSSIANLKSAESVVRDILKNQPETRNSDMELLFAVWTQAGVYLTPTQKEAIRKSFSPETIRRIRQKIQEQGEYLANENVLKERNQLQKAHRKLHAYPMKLIIEDKAFIQEPVGYKTKFINGKKMRFAVYN